MEGIKRYERMSVRMTLRSSGLPRNASLRAAGPGGGQTWSGRTMQVLKPKGLSSLPSSCHYYCVQYGPYIYKASLQMQSRQMQLQKPANNSLQLKLKEGKLLKVPS